MAILWGWKWLALLKTINSGKQADSFNSKTITLAMIKSFSIDVEKNDFKVETP